jgi:hypothetical protein
MGLASEFGKTLLSRGMLERRPLQQAFQRRMSIELYNRREYNRFLTPDQYRSSALSLEKTADARFQ